MQCQFHSLLGQPSTARLLQGGRRGLLPDSSHTQLLRTPKLHRHLPLRLSGSAEGNSSQQGGSGSQPGVGPVSAHRSAVSIQHPPRYTQSPEGSRHQHGNHHSHHHGHREQRGDDGSVKVRAWRSHVAMLVVVVGTSTVRAVAAVLAGCGLHVDVFE